MKLELNIVKCSEVMPESDGYYVVVDLWKGKVYSVCTVNYTVEGGWNTSRRCDGTLSDEHALHYEDVEKYPDFYWANASVLTEDDDE